jgi:hypothetical protein
VSRGALPDRADTAKTDGCLSSDALAHRGQAGRRDAETSVSN